LLIPIIAPEGNPGRYFTKKKDRGEGRESCGAGELMVVKKFIS
jgi:hypothetical protein